MYTPQSFLVKDKQTLYNWIDDIQFGKLITSRRGRIEITPMPFALDREKGELLGHVARSNSHWQSAMMADDLVALFEGPHGYVSPTWYSQPDGVPTWNYVAVQVFGKAELIKTEAESLVVFQQLTETSESRYGNGWSIFDLDNEKMKQLLKAIVFFRIKIRGLEGKAKLSQNRSKMDRVGVIQQLAATEDTQLQTLSKWMRDTLKDSPK